MSPPPEYIPFARPSIGVKEEEAALGVLRSGWLTSGSEVLAFEKEFAKLLDLPHALAVNSATTGLHLALEALEIPRESWVVTSPFTFTATSGAVRHRGAHPLFVDIEEDSLNIDPAKVEATIGSSGEKISALLPIHLSGLPCRVDKLVQLAEEHGLPIVEDCAHALPATFDGRATGTWGDVGVFSFYATKPVTTGEGGMVVTANTDLAERIAQLRSHGIDRQVWDRYHRSGANKWEYDVVAPGFKCNLPDLAAAIGRVQLARSDEFYRARRHIARSYLEELRGVDGLRLPKYDEGHSWHLFIVQLIEGEFPLDRDRFVEAMTDEGIGVSVHYKPLHLMSYYASKYRLSPGDFPVATKVFQRCVSLPIYPGLRDDEVGRIVEVVRMLSRG